MNMLSAVTGSSRRNCGHRTPVRRRHPRPLVAVLRSGFQNLAGDELFGEPVEDDLGHG